MEIFKDIDGHVFEWVISKLNNGEEYSNDLTLGIKLDNILICGIVFSVSAHITYLSIYATNPAWCNRTNLTKIFGLPFDAFGSKAVKCLTSHKNRKINKLLWGLGLKEEGHLRYARADGSHQKVFSITQDELKKKEWYERNS